MPSLYNAMGCQVCFLGHIVSYRDDYPCSVFRVLRPLLFPYPVARLSYMIYIYQECASKARSSWFSLRCCRPRPYRDQPPSWHQPVIRRASIPMPPDRACSRQRPALVRPACHSSMTALKAISVSFPFLMRARRQLFVAPSYEGADEGAGCGRRPGCTTSKGA